MQKLSTCSKTRLGGVWVSLGIVGDNRRLNRQAVERGAEDQNLQDTIRRKVYLGDLLLDGDRYGDSY